MKKNSIRNDKQGESGIVAVMLMLGGTVVIAAMVFLMCINISGVMGKGPVFVSATIGNNMDDCFVTIQGTSKPLPCQDIRAQYINTDGVAVESAMLDKIYYTCNDGNLTYIDSNHNAMLDNGDQIKINTHNSSGKLVLISTSSNNIIIEVQI